jgi:hypothetical protein
MKIGFFFNHDQCHQVAHSLPIALSLMRNVPEAEVVIATANAQLSAEVRRLAASCGAIVPVVELGLKRPLSRLVARKLNAVVPAAKLAIYRDNLEFFRGLDALVVSEKTSLILKTRYGLDQLRMIHTRHGAGDRAIGFCKASARFDQIMVSGPKVRERLIRDAGVSPARLSMVGYPKFDLMPTQKAILPFADPSKPTVLYNPHVSPHLSSWYKDGRAVLDHFLADDRFNLIFAPHVMLFHRRFVLTIDKFRFDRPGLIDPRVLDAPNIHVDLGSRASTDMTYTHAADIYLGDVSSQIYEFIHRPRPCIFLNSHNVAHWGDANYLHWSMGEVIGSVADLGRALDSAEANHHRYRPAQRQLFQRTFDLTGEPSADRAARAIVAAIAPSEPLRLPIEAHGAAIAA